MGISANDGKWHHICVSWSSSNGQWHAYKDGEISKRGSDFKRGYEIKGGGAVTVGQDQDSLGDRFEAYQSFKGSLAHVNVWNCVLPLATIREMSKSCYRGEGNVYKWSDFSRYVRGNTTVVVPSPCVLQQEWVMYYKHTVFKLNGQSELWINIVAGS